MYHYFFRRHVCLSNLKHVPSRELLLTARKTVFSHLKWQKINYARNIEIRRKHTFMITKKICMPRAFNLSFVQNTFFNKGYLYRELSKIFKDFCGKFKDFLRTSHNIIFQFSRTFQGHNAFSRTFQGPCEPCMSDCVINLVFSGVLKHYTHPWYHLKKGLILGVKTCETHEWHKTMNTKKPLRSQHNRAGENNS